MLSLEDKVSAILFLLLSETQRCGVVHNLVSILSLKVILLLWQLCKVYNISAIAD